MTKLQNADVPVFTKADCHLLSRFKQKVSFDQVEASDQARLRDLRIRLKTLSTIGAEQYSGRATMRWFVSVLNPNGRTPEEYWCCIYPTRVPNKSFGLQVALIVSSTGAEMCFCLGAGTSQERDPNDIDRSRDALEQLRTKLRSVPDQIIELVQERCGPLWRYRRHWRQAPHSQDFNTLKEWIAHASLSTGSGASVSRNFTPKELTDLGPTVSGLFIDAARSFSPILDYVYADAWPVTVVEMKDVVLQWLQKIKTSPSPDRQFHYKALLLTAVLNVLDRSPNHENSFPYSELQAAFMKLQHELRTPVHETHFSQPYMRLMNDKDPHQMWFPEGDLESFADSKAELPDWVRTHFPKATLHPTAWSLFSSAEGRKMIRETIKRRWPSDPFHDALSPDSTRKIFKIAPGELGRFWEDCRRDGAIYLGWDAIGDLRMFPDSDEEAFPKVFRSAFPDDYEGSAGKQSTGTRKAREAWAFRGLRPGDIILANKGISEILAFGEVIEPGYFFKDDRQEYKHAVSVRWDESLAKPLSGILPQNLKVVWSNNTVVPVDRDVYRLLLSGEKTEPPISIDQTIDYREPSLEEIVNSIRTKGLHLTERMIRRYHSALKSRGFVILSGVSGTGKTWLAEEYARAVGAELCLVPVAPNWNSNEDLLGFLSPLSDNTYQHTEFSRFLETATQAYRMCEQRAVQPKPFHLVLDEMNLARVEHYFAKFLSAMEIRARHGRATINLSQDLTVDLPPNLFFVGTVNIDETTHLFADKVYDRAQLLELELDEEELRAFLGQEEFAETLMQIWGVLKDVAPFAFRVVADVRNYIAANTAIGVEWRLSFDEAILQKILPKIKGTEPQVGEALQSLIDLIAADFPLSHNKAVGMLQGFRNHGIASFF